MNCFIRIWRISWRYKKFLIFACCLAFITIIGNLILLHHQNASGLQEFVEYRWFVESAANRYDMKLSNGAYNIDNIVQNSHRTSSNVVKLYGDIPDNSIKAAENILTSPSLNIRAMKTKKFNLNESKLEYFYYRERATKVNEYNYTIIVSPKPLCSEDTFMIILIHSFHTRIERRKAIRSTWASVARTNGSWPGIGKIRESLKIIFILGLHQDPGLNEVALEESERYSDIVVGNFFDSYRNMTLKSLLGLKLVKEQCSNVSYLLKSDDDMFINLPYLIDLLNTHQPHRSIMGPYIEDAKVRRTGKWGLTREEFPMEIFPPYEAGSAYIITGDIVSKLFQTAEYVPPIFVDDVYVTGVLGRILNITHIRQGGFAFATSKVPTACDVILRRIVTGTKATPEILTKIWAELKEKSSQRNSTCKPETDLKKTVTPVSFAWWRQIY